MHSFPGKKNYFVRKATPVDGNSILIVPNANGTSHRVQLFDQLDKGDEVY